MVLDQRCSNVLRLLGFLTVSLRALKIWHRYSVVNENTTLGQIASRKWQRFVVMFSEDDDSEEIFFAHNLKPS